MRKLICIVLVVGIAGTAQAASFARRVRQANQTLASGDAQGALTQYRDLQFDEPESDYLHYGVGCAHYALGTQAIEAGLLSNALDEFGKAEEGFSSATNSDNADMRLAARFNEANSLAERAIVFYEAGMNQVRLADIADPGKKAEEAFEEAIESYETLLRDYPDHPEARANLDHMRYLLKKLLQDPPPQQEQKEQQGGDDEQKEDGEEGDKQDQEKQQQEQEQQQDGDKQEQPEQSEDQQKQDAGNEQQPPQEQKQSEADSEPEEGGEPDAEERQNIEAILQSLEDMDQQEQEDRRTGPIEAKPRKEWW
ncbi:MAG: hypothetical protein GY851_11485 [bacterium]|nr:hypothetical protein [bacterium]